MQLSDQIRSQFHQIYVITQHPESILLLSIISVWDSLLEALLNEKLFPKLTTQAFLYFEFKLQLPHCPEPSFEFTHVPAWSHQISTLACHSELYAPCYDTCQLGGQEIIIRWLLSDLNDLKVVFSSRCLVSFSSRFLAVPMLTFTLLVLALRLGQVGPLVFFQTPGFLIIRVSLNYFNAIVLLSCLAIL